MEKNSLPASEEVASSTPSMAVPRVTLGKRNLVDFLSHNQRFKSNLRQNMRIFQVRNRITRNPYLFHLLDNLLAFPLFRLFEMLFTELTISKV